MKNSLYILLVMLMMSCSGSSYVPSDNNYDYRYYDEYYNGYYPSYDYYRNYYNYPYRRYYPYNVPQQNGGIEQLNTQRGVRPSRTVIAPLGPPRRNVTPNRTVTPSGTPSRTGRDN